MTSPIAEMPAHAGAEQLVHHDVAAIERQSGFRGAEPVGHRAAAGRDEQLLDGQRFRLAARLISMRARCPPRDLGRRDLGAVRTVMPRFLNAFSSSAETASSSFGTMRGRSSMSVTSLPNRRKIDANSTPTAPLPMIAIDFGHLGECDRLVARDDVLLVDLDARHAARRGSGGDDDLSRGERRAPAPPVTSTLPPPASRPVPLIHSILFFLNRNSTPLVRPVTILFLRACTRAMSIVGLTSALPKLMPHSARPARSSARARARAAPWSECSPS